MIALTPINYERWHAFCEADPVGAFIVLALLLGITAIGLLSVLRS